VQPRQAFDVVAQHRVPQRLAFPSHDPGRIRPAHPPLQRLRNGQRPQRRTPVRLALREPPQLHRAHVVPDHQATCSHCPLLRRTDRKATTLQPGPDITTKSQLKAISITRLISPHRPALLERQRATGILGQTGSEDATPALACQFVDELLAARATKAERKGRL